MYIEKVLDLLSSAHEKWGQKQKCCVYNFGQCSFFSSETPCSSFPSSHQHQTSTTHRLYQDLKASELDYENTDIIINLCHRSKTKSIIKIG